MTDQNNWGGFGGQSNGSFDNQQTKTADDGCLDWDDEISNDNDFVVLEEGIYPFTIKALERGQYISHAGSKLPDCKKVIVHITIDGGTKGTVDTKENMFLHRSCEGILCAFFVSLGLRQKGQPLKMCWNDAVGKTGWVKTGIRVHDGKKYTQVKSWVAPDDVDKQNSGFSN